MCVTSRVGTKKRKAAVEAAVEAYLEADHQERDPAEVPCVKEPRGDVYRLDSKDNALRYLHRLFGGEEKWQHFYKESQEQDARAVFAGAVPWRPFMQAVQDKARVQLETLLAELGEAKDAGGWEAASLNSRIIHFWDIANKRYKTMVEFECSTVDEANLLIALVLHYGPVRERYLSSQYPWNTSIVFTARTRRIEGPREVRFLRMTPLKRALLKAALPLQTRFRIDELFDRVDAWDWRTRSLIMAQAVPVDMACELFTCIPYPDDPEPSALQLQDELACVIRLATALQKVPQRKQLAAFCRQRAEFCCRHDVLCVMKLCDLF